MGELRVRAGTSLALVVLLAVIIVAAGFQLWQASQL
jgi:hypothetical protein